MSDFASLGLVYYGGSGLEDASDVGRRNYAVVGAGSVETRIGRLFRAVTLGVMDANLRVEIAKQVAPCGSRNDWCQLVTGFDHLQKTILYRKDPEGLDLFQTYRVSVESRGGDCGSMTAAMDTHAAVLGFPVGCCTLATRNPETGIVEWSHVYALAWITSIHGRRRVAFDISEPGVKAGWEPQVWRYVSKRDWIYDAKRWADWFMAGANDERLPSVT